MRVNFVVMRSAETQEEGGSSREGQHSRTPRRMPEPQYFRRQSTYMKVTFHVSSRVDAQTQRKEDSSWPCFFSNYIFYIHISRWFPAVVFYHHNVGHGVLQTLHVSVYTV